MIETKVKGLKVKIYDNKITVEDTYPITNIEKIVEILSIIEEKDAETLIFLKRDINSLVREWRGRSRLYRLGFKKKVTKDCVFKEYNSKGLEIFYFIMSFYTTTKKKKRRK